MLFTCNALYIGLLKNSGLVFVTASAQPINYCGEM